MNPTLYKISYRLPSVAMFVVMVLILFVLLPKALSSQTYALYNLIAVVIGIMLWGLLIWLAWLKPVVGGIILILIGAFSLLYYSWAVMVVGLGATLFTSFVYLYAESYGATALISTALILMFIGILAILQPYFSKKLYSK